MSFSTKVKEELSACIPLGRHCQLAELAAMISLCGRVVLENETASIHLQTENRAIIRKYFTLLKKAFIINTDVCNESDTIRVLEAIKAYNGVEPIHDLRGGVNSLLVSRNCCKRAYLRGAFTCAGSMSDPKKGYHLELVCNHLGQAEQLKEIIRSFGLEARTIVRKKYYVVYLKESAGIVDLLNIMGAHHSLMDLENLRIEKEVRNSVNRQVNCEAANITKTVTAASRQIEDIMILRERYGFNNLPDNLRAMAEMRLEYPESSLKELGELLDPPVGKSGVNHRLRKLSELADKLRSDDGL
ncbi:MAG: DNA-binding protein WhiA [Lachnospiraceae bacterium]|jgi:DNA-binding protein WhiA|nr:DNA-binding protein WhiA [Lachnospiraceae bacterium]